jgi:hypothetical protein
MRSHKCLLVSATLLALLSATGLSLADDTPSHTHPPSSTSPSVPSTSTTVTTPTTTTTTTTPVTPTTPTTTPLPPATTSTTTSTTTTTAADTEAIMPPTVPPTRESVTVYERQRPNRPLLITGGLLLVATYGTTAAIVGANGEKPDRDLYIPVAGPWINVADRSCTGDCGDHKRDTVLIVGSGVLQGVGALMVISSFLIPEKVAKAQITAGPVKMQVAPTGNRGGGGIGAFGTF